MDAKLLERAIKGWDYFSTLITEDGYTILTTFNQNWGTTIDEWGIYFWLNTVDLLKTYISREKLDEWNKKIDLATGIIVESVKTRSTNEEHIDDLKNHTVQNHYIWTVLCCYRYGMLRCDLAIMELAEREMGNIIRNQSSAGIWLEGRTLVVAYSELSLCAVSLFEHYSRSAEATAAVNKGLEYVLSVIYPDFTKISCLDDRNRYNRKIVHCTAPTFYKNQKGLVYISRWIDYFKNSQKIGKNLSGLVFITEMTQVIPEDIPFNEESIEKYIPGNVLYDTLKTSITRKNGWVATFCCLENYSSNNRWILERQGLFSIPIRHFYSNLPGSP